MSTELQIRQKQMEKAWRSQIRLAYSLLADAEIERNLPEFRETISRALALGQSVKLTPAEVTIDGKSVEAIVSGATND